MRPNILLITTDQQRWDTIHAAGNPYIFTPHLNWLCDTGVRYSRAYSECPVCMPARATIMSGLPAYRHGALGNVQGEPLRGKETIPSILTAQGYETRAQGKMHFEPMRKKFGFETMELAYDYYRQKGQEDPDRVGSRHGMGQNEMEPVIGSTDENHTLTRWVVDRSIDFLETRDEELPFFLWTSISKPHPPFDPSLKFWEMYRDAELPDPIRGDWSQSVDDIPSTFVEATAHLNSAFRYSPQQMRKIKQAYYACITEIDTNLGRLFAVMREKGLFENTVIIFTSDHGEMLGDHGLGAKGTFFEGSAHVPLMVRPAGEWDQNPLRGTVCDTLVGLQDILPTCLSLAGVEERPEDAKGIDLLAAAKGDASRERLSGQCDASFTQIEGNWKYLYGATGGGELLFNLEEDPLEQRNLAGEEAERCAAMKAELEKELAEAGSSWLEEDKIKTLPERPWREVRRFRSWPGFHSQEEPTDLLH